MFFKYFIWLQIQVPVHWCRPLPARSGTSLLQSGLARSGTGRGTCSCCITCARWYLTNMDNHHQFLFWLMNPCLIQRRIWRFVGAGGGESLHVGRVAASGCCRGCLWRILAGFWCRRTKNLALRFDITFRLLRKYNYYKFSPASCFRYRRKAPCILLHFR